MAYTIAEIIQNRKVQDFLLILSVILLGGISFGLGRLSALEAQDGAVELCEVPMLQASAVHALQTPTAGGVGESLSPAPDKPTVPTQETYVASRNGTVYHFPWCSGAQRIKEENKVWFQTKEEAERAGYRPASNCKGL